MNNGAAVDFQSTQDAPPPSLTILLGLLPWLAVWCGSYALHSGIATFFFYHGLCLGGTIVVRRRYGPWKTASVPIRNWIALASGCLLICLGTFVSIGLINSAAVPARVIAAIHGQHIPFNWTACVLLFSYFAIVNPVIEENFWRGTIYSSLRRRGIGVRVCIGIDAVLFGSWHWLIVRLFLPPLLALIVTAWIVIFGAFFCRFYERTKSIPAVSLLHGLGADVPVLIMLWFGVLCRLHK
jgi:membrane protease YdiL (CAAX protease family)